MKKLGYTVLILAATGLLCGCMSDHEYMLRKTNADNQAAHAQTYEPLVIKGPITIDQGASITATVPSQPFQPLAVPDGVEAQRGIIRDVVTGAVVGYGLNQAGNSNTVRTTTTGGTP